MPSTVPKIEVQYYPQPNCSGNPRGDWQLIQRRRQPQVIIW